MSPETIYTFEQLTSTGTLPFQVIIFALFGITDILIAIYFMVERKPDKAFISIAAGTILVIASGYSFYQYETEQPNPQTTTEAITQNKNEIETSINTWLKDNNLSTKELCNDATTVLDARHASKIDKETTLACGGETPAIYVTQDQKVITLEIKENKITARIETE